MGDGISGLVNSGEFVPTQLAGLVAWYDFSNIATLWKDEARTSAVTADADVIKGVTDLSGVGNHLSVAVNGPAYKVNIKNGRSVARFDGVNDNLVSAAASNLNAWTTFAVFYNNDLVETSTVVGDSVNDTQSIRVNITTGAVELYAGTEVVGYGTSAATWYVGASVMNNAASSAWMNGGAPLLDAANPGASDLGTIKIGSNLGGTVLLGGDIAEVLTYSGVLTTAQMNTIGQYLASKWGITWTTIVNPTDISGLVAWYDFSAQYSIWEDAALSNQAEVDDVILGVTDKSSNGNHLTATNGPAWKAAIQNGRNVARFAADLWLDSPAMTLSQPTTYVYVAKQNSKTVPARFTDAAAGARQLTGLTITNGYIDMHANATINDAVDHSGAFHVFVFIFNGASSKVYADGGAAALTGDPGSAGLGTLRLGNDSGGFSDTQGDIAELTLYNVVLSLTNINAVGQYLANKWGTTWTTAT